MPLESVARTPPPATATTSSCCNPSASANGTTDTPDGHSALSPALPNTADQANLVVIPSVSLRTFIVYTTNTSDPSYPSYPSNPSNR